MAQYTLKNFPQGGQMGNFFSGLRGMFGGGENSLFKRQGNMMRFNRNFQMPQGAFGGMFEPRMYSLDSPFKPTATGDIQGQGLFGAWGPQHALFNYNKENKRRKELGLDPIYDTRSGTPATARWASPTATGAGAQLAQGTPNADAVAAFRKMFEAQPLPMQIRQQTPGDELYDPTRPRMVGVSSNFNPLQVEDNEMRKWWIAQYELNNPGVLPNEILKMAGYKRKGGQYIKI